MLAFRTNLATQILANPNPNEALDRVDAAIAERGRGERQFGYAYALCAAARSRFAERS